MEQFYVGASELTFLTMDVEVPPEIGFCLSHRRLQRRPRQSAFPAARHKWMLDSGSFGYCNAGEPLPSPESYVAAVRRYDAEIGGLEWAAQQDLMCEPWMLAKTGRAVAENQRLNKENFWRLHELWWRAEELDYAAEHGLDPDEVRFDGFRADLTLLPFKPTLQGWEPDDYRRDVEMWYAAGVNLHEVNVVGLGSVCRRAATKPIRTLIEELSGYLDLHGFGLKTDALRTYGPVLPTADSHAWSEGTRHEEERWPCRHGRVKWERNCPLYAMQWGARIFADSGKDIHWESRWKGVPEYAATNGRVARSLAPHQMDLFDLDAWAGLVLDPTA